MTWQNLRDGVLEEFAEAGELGREWLDSEAYTFGRIVDASPIEITAAFLEAMRPHVPLVSTCGYRVLEERDGWRTGGPRGPRGAW